MPKASPPTRRSSPRSRAQTSPAAFTPATQRRCGRYARRPSRGTSGSGRTSPTWTERDSVGATSRSTRTTLAQQIVQQIAALRIEAGLEHGVVGYVKPHGALYNRAAVDRVYADAVVTAIASVDRHLTLLGPPDSELLLAAAAHGLEGVAEGFADRAYRPDGTLAPRSEPDSVLTREQALGQAVRLAGDARYRSLCIHSDTPGAADLAIAIRNRLIGAGFEIRPFS